MNLLKRVRAFQIELEFGKVGFWERGKPEYLEKNLSEQGKEPTTNSTTFVLTPGRDPWPNNF